MSLPISGSPVPEAPEARPKSDIDTGQSDVHCRYCGTLLKADDNWSPSDVRNNKKRCNKCRADYNREYNLRVKQQGPTKRSMTQVRQRLIRRIRDEERIQAITNRIVQYNTEYGRRLYVRSQMDALEKGIKSAAKELSVAEWEQAKQGAEERAQSLTYERLPKQPEDFVIAEILLTYKIIEPIDGDTKATWHIGFSNAGYRQYELDVDGLPLPRLGISRLYNITYAIQKADHRFAKRRIGITMALCKEPRRGNKPERRVVLCKTKGVYDQKATEHKQRVDGMNRSLEQLEESMAEPIDQTKQIVDIFTDAYNRNQ
jgi:hypothetical protein